MFFYMLLFLCLYIVDVVFHMLQQLFRLAESVLFHTLFVLLQKPVHVILDVFLCYFNQQWILLAICFPYPIVDVVFHLP